MISEGMEERGSTGFRDAIKWAINNNWIGPNEVSAVISTNSQWILEVVIIIILLHIIINLG